MIIYFNNIFFIEVYNNLVQEFRNKLLSLDILGLVHFVIVALYRLELQKRFFILYKKDVLTRIRLRAEKKRKYIFAVWANFFLTDKRKFAPGTFSQ